MLKSWDIFRSSAIYKKCKITVLNIYNNNQMHFLIGSMHVLYPYARPIPVIAVTVVLTDVFRVTPTIGNTIVELTIKLCFSY